MNTGERARTERRLAAILAADVAGYSRLIGADEAGTLDRMKSIRTEVMGMRWHSNGKSGTSPSAPSRRFKAPHATRRALPSRSTTRMRRRTPSWRMRMWGSEWEAAISEARTALALNPNSAFVISMLGCVLGFGGYHDEALDRLRQAMRASPHDPLTWLWTMWSGSIQFYSRKFDAALETFNQLVRLRPEYGHAQALIAWSMAFLGRLDEAREVLERARLRLPDPRMQQRPPWLRLQDYALRLEGRRLAAGEKG